MGYDASVAYLQRIAPRVIAKARLRASDGTTLYTPGYDPATGDKHEYRRMWVRDFAYVVEGAPDLISAADIARGFVFVSRRQRADGAFPDAVSRDGEPDYFSAGDQPLTDVPQFMVKLAHAHFRRTGDPNLYRRYRRSLIRGMLWVPRRDHLVWIDPAHPHSGYGFTDGIAKTGHELFSSLLYVEASRLLAVLERESGRNGNHWSQTANATRNALGRLWDRRAGMFLAASRENRQVDVWGSAYAAFAHIATKARTRRIAAWLRRNYRGIVQRGQVRHTAPGTHWQRTFGFPPGTFQNGAYWGTASGWVAAVIATADPSLAKRMIRALAADYRANGVNEFVGGADSPPGWNCVGYANYAANAALPLQALRRILAGPHREAAR